MKDTRLNEDAAIYSRREERDARAKWSSLSKKEKITYFKDYYLKFVIIITALAGMLIWFIVTMLSPKKEMRLNITMVNSSMSQQALADFEAAVSDILEINPEKEEIFIDDSFHISTDGEIISQTDMASQEKLTVFASVGDLDILISDRATFERYSKMGIYYNLADALPSDLYNRLSENLVLSQVPDEDTEPFPYGIRLETYPKYKSLQIQIQDPIIGICASSKNRENAVTVIQMLTNTFN